MSSMLRLVSFMLVALIVGDLNAATNSLVIDSQAIDAYAGDNLQTPLQFDIDLSKQGSALLRLSQYSADVKVILRGDGKPEVTSPEYSFSAHKSFPEYVWVDLENCSEKCSVEVQGVSEFDRAVAYSVDVFDGDAIGHGDQKLLKAVSVAARQSLLADQSSGAVSKKHRQAARDELSAAYNSSDIDVSLDYKMHVAILLADQLDELVSRDEQKKFLRQLINVEDNRGSSYLAYAHYELAPLLSDHLEQRNHYDKGMQIAERVGNLHLWAKGANYKAVSLVRDALYEQAFDLLEQAYKIYSDSGSVKRLLDPLHNLSWASRRAGQPNRAISYASQQKLLSEQYSDEENVLWSLYNLGLAYGLLGEKFTSEEFLDVALDRWALLAQKSDLAPKNLYGYLWQEKARLNLIYGDYDSAKVFVEKMLKAFLDLGWPGQVADARFLNARIEFARNNYKIAREMFEAAIRYDRDNNRARSLTNRMLVFADLELIEGNLELASKLNVGALNSLPSDDDENRVKALTQSLAILNAYKRFDTAVKLAIKIAPLVNGHNQDHEFTLYQFHKAVALAGANQYAAANKALLLAEQRVESVIPKVKREDHSQTFLALQRDIYELGIHLLTIMHPDAPDKALSKSEAFHGRTLAQKINLENRVDISASKDYQAALKMLLANAGSLYTNKDVSQTLVESRLLSEKLSVLEAKNTEYRSYSSLRHPKLDNIIGSLAETEVVLAYFVGNKTSWAWAISNAGVKQFELPSEQKLVALIDRFNAVFSINPSARSGISYQQQLRLLADLGDVLLRPLSDLPKQYTQLTLIPSGLLNSVPFSALYLPASQKHLVQEFSIAFTSSLITKQQLEQQYITKPKPSTISAAVVVAPYFNDDFSFAKPLAQSARESTALQHALKDNVELFEGRSATKGNLLGALGLRDFSLLHLATHGLMNDEQSDLSALLFAQSDDSDELWLLPEIASANLSLDLVVLSACRTADGEAIGSEGVNSLSRAFIEAGASSVVGALWDVDDYSTSLIFKRFYSYLIDDSLTVAASLQHAQLAAINSKTEDLTDPYYWASFQLNGQGGVILGGTK